MKLAMQMLCVSCSCFVFLSQRSIALHVPLFPFIYLYNILIGCLALLLTPYGYSEIQHSVEF